VSRAGEVAIRIDGEKIYISQDGNTSGSIRA